MSDERFRCPHCKTELPEKASFCAACGRRIEGWSLPKDATPAMGETALPDAEGATRQMQPTPSLLRAAAISAKKGSDGAKKDGGAVDKERGSVEKERGRAEKERGAAGKERGAAGKERGAAGKERDQRRADSARRGPRSMLPLVLGMLVVAAAGAVGAFFLVRARMRRTREKPPLVAVVPTTTGPMVVTSPEPSPPVAPPPPPPSTMLLRKSKTGKKAHVIASAPVPVATPAPSGKKRGGSAGGGLPHKAVATDSRSLSAQAQAQAQAAATAPATMPTVEHETTEAKPSTEAEQKQEAEAQLDADSVRLVVRQHLPQVRACYGRAFKDTSPGGTVEIGFAIDAAGRATNVRTETNTTDSESLAHCLEARVKEWQFPRPVGGDYELIYPFVFAPGS